jgi:hypothetical protein
MRRQHHRGGHQWRDQLSGLAAAVAALGCKEDELLTTTNQTLQVHPAEDPAQQSSA